MYFSLVRMCVSMCHTGKENTRTHVNPANHTAQTTVYVRIILGIHVFSLVRTCVYMCHTGEEITRTHVNPANNTAQTTQQQPKKESLNSQTEHCSTLQHTVTHCNMLQHTAAHLAAR